MYNKHYYNKNKDKIKATVKRYYNKNKDKIKKYRKNYNKIHYQNNKTNIMQKSKNYYLNNKNKIKEHNKKIKVKRQRYMKNYFRNKRNKDIYFKLRQNMSIYAYQALKGNKLLNKQHFSFTTEELKTHLEKEFYFGISWTTYGLTWQLGHKIPLSWFKGNTEEYYKIGWSINNLFPILILDNQMQSDKYAILNNTRIYSKEEAIKKFYELYKGL